MRIVRCDRCKCDSGTFSTRVDRFECSAGLVVLTRDLCYPCFSEVRKLVIAEIDGYKTS